MAWHFETAASTRFMIVKRLTMHMTRAELKQSWRCRFSSRRRFSQHQL